MALFELSAFEAAYQALQPLDAAARRRALQWLSDALGVPQALPEIASTGTPAGASVAPQTTAASRSGRGRSAPSGGRTPGGRRRPVSAPAPARRRRVRGGDAASDERAYRRMPPPDDVLAAYRQVGTVSGLADHFGVPRHTVQGWARRLRSQGYQIGRQG